MSALHFLPKIACFSDKSVSSTRIFTQNRLFFGQFSVIHSYLSPKPPLFRTVQCHLLVFLPKTASFSDKSVSSTRIFTQNRLFFGQPSVIHSFFYPKPPLFRTAQCHTLVFIPKTACFSDSPVSRL